MKWCDRALFVSPVWYGLCTNEKQFHATLRELGIKGSHSFMKTKQANATTHFLDGKDTCAIVALGDTSGKSTECVHGLIVHEAMHIWREIRDHVGEESPSAEFEAYAIQTIAQRLMESWHEQTKGKKRGR